MDTQLVIICILTFGINETAILFEQVPGFPDVMRLVAGATNSSKRLALAIGFPVP